MPASIEYIQGDLFDAPNRSILLHSCNTRGSWGSGTATAFRDRFPLAYEAYRDRCKSKGEELIGSCLLTRADEELGDDGQGGRKEVTIGCLFTSRGYGKNKDPPDVILENTESALVDLKGQLELLNGEGVEGSGDGSEKGWTVHACKFNSGLFKVEWERTAEVIQEVELSMTVYER